MLSAVQLSLIVGLIAASVGAPALFNITDAWTQQLTGLSLADNGRPNLTGLIAHGLVAAGITYGVLYFTAPQPIFVPPLSI